MRTRGSASLPKTVSNNPGHAGGTRSRASAEQPTGSAYARQHALAPHSHTPTLPYSHTPAVNMRWPWQRTASDEPAHLRAGVWGEKVAERALKKKGYRILGRRVRVGRKDELDLIARDCKVLVFVEVKTRGSEQFGRPIEAVNQKKRNSLSRAAVRYMERLKNKPDFFRFDVVEVVGGETSPDPVVRHVENAFTLASPYRVWW